MPPRPIAIATGRRASVPEATRVTIQELGSLGELIAALATLVTLVYLAAQVRQNTLALRSATFESISEKMAQNVQPLLTNGELAELILKGYADSESLTPEERVRFNALLVASIRRMESVYIQEQIGSLEPDLARGFELSLLSLLKNPGAAKWWATARVTFNPRFVDHVDTWLRENETLGIHPSMGVAID
jgi:hypothetical protein